MGCGEAQEEGGMKSGWEKMQGERKVKRNVQDVCQGESKNNQDCVVMGKEA